MSSKEQRGAEVMEAIRSVLYDDWDPIGVKDEAPRDEYDAYIGGIYRLLSRGASEHDIAEHLRSLESARMGLTPRTTQSLLPVARNLLAINIAIESGGG